MPTACKSIKMRDIQHYLQNFESLSQILVRPEEFLFCSIPGEKKALEKATVSFQDEEYTFKKTSLCSRGSGLRGKHICQPHFALFGAPQLHPELSCSWDPLPGPQRHNIAFIYPSPQELCEENRFLVRRGRVPRKSIVYRVITALRK